jgi:hypothetical protein
MIYASIISTLPAAIIGVVAATYWWKASRIPVLHPYREITLVDGTPGEDLYAEPEFWVHEIQGAYEASSRLNATAAIWTAIAAFVGGTAPLLQKMIETF